MGLDVLLQGLELPGAFGLRGQALRFGLRTCAGVAEVPLMCGLRRISARCLPCGLDGGDGKVRAAVAQRPPQPGTARMGTDEDQQAHAEPQGDGRHCRPPPAAR